MKRLHLKPIPFYIQMTVFLPLVMVLLLLVGILIFNRMQNTPVIEETQEEQIQVSPIGVLCILREEETAFFTIVTVDASAGTVTAKPLTDEKTATVYRESGAAVLLEHLQKDGGRVDFYIDVTFEQMREWLQHLGGGAAVTLEEGVTYTDETGLAITFPSGAVTLSANQTADMLRAVAKRNTAPQTVADLWKNIVNGYITKDRNFMSDYTALTDIGDTDIRIYDFHKALPYLKKMAKIH